MKMVKSVDIFDGLYIKIDVKVNDKLYIKIAIIQKLETRCNCRYFEKESA